MTTSASDTTYDVLFKIIMIGDQGAGKTQLVLRYTKNDFDEHSGTTLGVEFTTHKITVDGKIVAAQLWDTAGQEKFESLASIYYRGSAGAILVYDITKRESFDHIVKLWVPKMKSLTEVSTVAILIGNKCDLANKREVPTADAATFASRNGIHIPIRKTSRPGIHGGECEGQYKCADRV